MELDILHRAVAPEIVEFYGAFTAESCVYYCMELMDAGSLDTLTGGGIPASQDPTAGAGAGVAVNATNGENGQNGTSSKEDGEAVLTVPEDVLKRITASVVRGLKFLKDELQIMHRGELHISSPLISPMHRSSTANV
jgi:mitogen-activated protein kinase kinase